MKHLLSWLVCVFVVAAHVTAVLGQGTVTFINDSHGLVKQWTSVDDSTLISVPKGGAFVQLAYAMTGTPFTPYQFFGQKAWLSWNSGWQLGPIVEINAPLPGRFNGGVVTLDGLPSGGDAQYVVFGWVGRAATFDEALFDGQMTGVTSPFTTPTGNPNLVPPGFPVPLSGTFTGLELGYIPEPSTFALVGLGAAFMLLFRRRK